ncbi:glycohydrolase toxin TNT-related protein [Agrobacterium larrymoorei]|uniref:Glycohydrolase toxin TNT-related protein n=1 Tax=Agrobacterium larrymoorei TaxID=160699 RepID=A0AAF0HBH9_9HYPH|nr:glycohydrolase toxin TNT-related protein [Agrobacterium larrymoorei]WHA44059.1 glycohydrolase toxin TNT-related protein [Agrobacterium larrymoorei]
MPDGGETNYLTNTRSYADKSGVQTPERAIPHTNESITKGNGEAELITGSTEGPNGEFICLKSDYQIQLENEAAPLRDQEIGRIDQQIRDFGINNGYLNQDGSAVPGYENSLRSDAANLFDSKEFAGSRPLSDFLSGTKGDHLAYMINRDQLMTQVDAQKLEDADSYKRMHCEAKHAVKPDTELGFIDRTFKTASGTGQQMAEFVGNEAPIAALTGGVGSAALKSVAAKQVIAENQIGVRQVIPDRTVGFVKREADSVAPPVKALDETQATKLSAGEPVSVANGEYLETWRDFFIPGTLPFDGARYMGLKLVLPAEYSPPLGPCQISTFDEVFSNPERGKLLFHSADGKEVRFDRPFNFLSSLNAGYPHLELRAPWLKQLNLKDRGLVKAFRQYNDDVYRLEQIEDLNGQKLIFHRNDDGWLEKVEGPDGLQLRFENDDQGRRTRIVLVGSEGSELELANYAYDVRGRMTEAQCSFGMSVRYAWFRESDLLASWNNLTRQSETHFTYNDDGRVVHTATNGIWNGDRFDYREGETRYFPGGNENAAQTFRYDDHENVTEEIDPLGGVVSHSYNKYGFRTSTADQNGHAHRTSYDIHGNVKEVVDAEGRSTIYGWGDNGELMIVIDGAGNRKTFKHDHKSNVIYETDAEGNVTHLRRDDLGHVVETQFPNSTIERRTWDTNNRLESVTDAKDNTTRFEYDEFNRLIATTSPNGSRIVREYTAGAGGFDTVSRIIRPDGIAVSRSFDGSGQLASVTDGEGRLWIYRYGAFGVLEAIVDPKGGELSLATDIEGRLISVTNAEGLTYSYERDIAGRVILEEDFDGRTWRYARDPAGQITETIKPDGARLCYSYDKSGLIKCIETFTAKDEPEDVTRFWYDGRGLLIRAENKAALVEFSRDRNGRIASETLNGKRLRSRHDAMGHRIRREILGLGASITDYVRDPLGAVEKLVTDETEITFERDSFGHEKARRMDGFNLLQRFDPAGQLVAQVAGPAAAHGLDASRLGWQFDRGNAPRQAGAIAEHVHRIYEYDRAFAPVSIDDGLWGKRQFTYDDNGQLTSAEASTGSERFAYDSARNIAGASSSIQTPDDPTPYGKAFDQTFGSVIPAAAPSNWQRSPSGVVQMARGPKGERIQLIHDDCGRVVERKVERDGFRPQRWRYGWDIHDRLVSVSTLDGEEWYFRYDPFGRRISKVRRFTGEEKDRVRRLWPSLVGTDGRPTKVRGTEAPSTLEVDNPPEVGTAYLWDGDHMVAEAPLRLDGYIAWDEATHWHFEDGTHRLLAKRQSDGEMLAVVCDHLGTPKEMFDTKGKLVWAADHHVWGAVRAARTFGSLAVARTHDKGSNELQCPWRFPGQYEDAESGLYYNRHRHYDPLTGQYASPDPIGLDGGDRPQGYVGNPLVRTDTSGLTSRLRYDVDAEAGGSSPYSQWQNPDGSFKWPPNNGAVPGSEKVVSLRPGDMMDRFGYDGGTYTSPIGVKYEQRALQPGTHLKPYKKFRVLKQFDVEKSTVSPWFGDPGLGDQYKLPSTVKDLLDREFIEEIK